MEKRKTILFFTNSDFGQANVVLAVLYELLRQNNFDVHVASWPNLEARLESLRTQVQADTLIESPPSITFHNLATFPGFTDFLETTKHNKKADVPHPPGRLGAERIAALTKRSLAVWAPKHYLSLFDWASCLTRQVDAALVILDPFLIPIHDMARHIQVRYVVLSPCTLADGLVPQQPLYSAIWKYPAFATGFKYPLPWSKLVDNLICYWNAKKCLWSPEVKSINKARQSRGITEPLGSFTPWVKGVPHISPSLPEIDLPMYTPTNVFNVGPILLASSPVSTADPDLSSWLKNGPTVLVALGTHFEAYTETVRELARGLRILLDANPGIQVLWKLKSEKASETAGGQISMAILEEAIEAGRVRITPWLEPDPIAILQSGHVICSVHHGGANSYFEAAWAGVPQVVLPMWYDTFDYAVRAEYLGIGVYGNRKAGNSCIVNNKNYVAPLMINGEELSSALLQVVGKTKEGVEPLRARADALGRLCRKTSGRVEAAKIIAQLC